MLSNVRYDDQKGLHLDCVKKSSDLAKCTVMELDQRDTRRSAARDFLEALDQLQASLEALDGQGGTVQTKDVATQAKPVANETYKTSNQPPKPASSHPASGRSADYGRDYGRGASGPKDLRSEGIRSAKGSPRSRRPGVRFTLNDLEMAIADIDRYMESQGNTPQPSLEDELE